MSFFLTVPIFSYCVPRPALTLTVSPRHFAIYGVGSVIDYAKNSKEVQKLPDNAVKALNVYLESVQKKDSTDNKEK